MNNEKSLINNSIEINNKSFKIPKLLFDKNMKTFNDNEIKEALAFNKNLLMENFISPNNLKFPLFRNIFQNYYT